MELTKIQIVENKNYLVHPIEEMIEKLKNKSCQKNKF
jgi:hypothetical protein